MPQCNCNKSRSGVFLVFEYAQHDLATLIDNHYTQHQCSPFSQSEVKRLMLQLLEAIRFMHSNYILHRDLKLSNLLYNHRGELRVADFGLARRVGGEYVGETKSSGAIGELESCLTPKVVSLWYRPPELLFGSESYDQGVDNWGAGCIMGELLRGKPLMDGRNEMDQLQKMFDFLGPPNIGDWPVCIIVCVPMMQHILMIKLSMNEFIFWCALGTERATNSQKWPDRTSKAMAHARQWQTHA